MDFDTPFVGEIAVAGFNFAPRGWALCQGQLLPISQNTALFSILGISFGGDGRVTFGVPDLRGRLPIGAGQGPGLTPYVPGEQVGSESVTLTTPQMPTHVHQPRGAADATSSSPAGAVFAPTPTRSYRAGTDGTFTFATLAPAGGSQPHENRQPFTVVTYAICLQGIYPSRP